MITIKAKFINENVGTQSGEVNRDVSKHRSNNKRRSCKENRRNSGKRDDRINQGICQNIGFSCFCLYKLSIMKYFSCFMYL